MKNTKKNNLKTRVIAGVLSAVCLFSVGAMSMSTAFAAKSTPSSYSRTMNSIKKDVKEIKESLRKYEAEKAKKAIEAKKSSASDKREKVITAGVESAINLAKGNYVGAASEIIKLFPYGGAISSAFEFFAGLIMEPEEPDKVPSATLDDIKEQLDNMKDVLNSVSEDIKLIKNQRFTDSVNNLIRILGSCSNKFNQIAKSNVTLSDAANALILAQKSGNQDEIAAAEKEYNTAKANATEIRSDIRLTNYDLSQLRQSLKVCKQYMMSMTLDGESDNPFLGYLEAKKSGAKTGDHMDDIIELCVKRDSKIFTVFNEGILLYSLCETNYINDLLEDGSKKDIREAAALTEDYVQFVTGFETSSKNGKITIDETRVDPNNANAVHDYYMTNIVPKEIENAGTYKYEDNRWDVKEATVTCNGTEKMFTNIKDAAAYADSYSNTEIKLYKDVLLDSQLEFKNAKSVKIDLNGHTIDAQGKCRVIKSDVDLTVTSSNGKGTIQNAYCDNGGCGGAICASCKNTVIENIKFINNKDSRSSGGAIYACNGFLKVYDCEFEGNSAEDYGGAIYVRGSDSSYTYIRYSNFNNNRAGSDGGAMYFCDTTADIYSTTVKNNYAGKDGGGIWFDYLYGDCHQLNGVTIENNRCGGEGGGIYCDSQSVSGAADVKLYRTVIIRNNYNSKGENNNAVMYACLKKPVFYVQDNFDASGSDIWVTGYRNDIAVAQFNSKDAAKSGSRAFHGDNGSVKLGNWYNTTLYYYTK